MQFPFRQVDLIKKNPPKWESVISPSRSTLNVIYQPGPLSWTPKTIHPPASSTSIPWAPQTSCGQTSPSSSLPFPNLHAAIAFLSPQGLDSCHLFKESLGSALAGRRHLQNKLDPAVLFRSLILSFSEKLIRKEVVVCVCVCTISHLPTRTQDSMLFIDCCSSNMWKHYLIQSQSSTHLTLQLTLCVPKQGHMQEGR